MQHMHPMHAMLIAACSNCMKFTVKAFQKESSFVREVDYLLLSRMWCTVGQAVVQFADWRGRSGEDVPVAIKFFASDQEFKHEMNVYMNTTSKLRECCPRVIES